MHKKIFLLFLIISPFLEASPNEPNNKRSAATSDINQELLDSVNQIQGEVELIRKEIGKPAYQAKNVAVLNPSYRQIYFQSLAMLRKTNRLSFEYIREESELPETLEKIEKIEPYQIQKVIHQTLEQITKVKNEMDIPDKAIRLAPHNKVDESTVLQTIMEINHQLNVMFDRPFSPSDVFQEVTAGVYLTSSILNSFPNSAKFPKQPALQHGKSPPEVYLLLIKCYRVLHDIFELSGLTIPTIEVDANHIKNVTPGEVYDIAALIVGEIAYLHSLINDQTQTITSYYPGRKFPSHVYQRTEFLLIQLEELQALVKKNLKWINNKLSSQRKKKDALSS